MSTPTQAEIEMPEARIREVGAHDVSGWAMLGVAVLLLVAAVVVGLVGGPGPAIAVAVVLLIAAVVTLRGLVAVSPGQAQVVQLLGRYRGTVRTEGLRWVNPLTSRRAISTRIRNHESDTTKVNDLDGNPIEMAAVVVWRVDDTAKAVFEVDDFVRFVDIQTESAVRHIAGSYPYDTTDESSRSLRENADEITAMLSAEIATRVESAGVHIIESRITQLAYAPEIAQVMLMRQQAGAVVAARGRIVEGAVGMVESALSRLEERGTVELDEERKATMVSNLLVVLAGDRSAQPVVNAGSLYQ
ncbi:SPFH domain-containing protein [Actinomycetospora endophytica]|uniref:SPFH domain-containing protein n=1 Tax=Actinomycetospora endophytica TaxID=2291215 RepID=A0ABS8PEL5_9PSEU|nr:SPFH domain-containing protein [Actinomycetospora endophytica]MCD2196423.1 SPFH domain-containing protein [Actinomycetospora endophytica]